MGWVVKATIQPLNPRQRDPVPITREAGWALGAGLDESAKSQPLPRFEPQTVQPVLGVYIDYI